jgi:hypothetical protein
MPENRRVARRRVRHREREALLPLAKDVLFVVPDFLPRKFADTGRFRADACAQNADEMNGAVVIGFFLDFISGYIF